MHRKKCVGLLIGLCLALGSTGCDEDENEDLAESIEPLLPAIGYVASRVNVHDNLAGNVLNLFPVVRP